MSVIGDPETPTAATVPTSTPTSSPFTVKGGPPPSSGRGVRLPTWLAVLAAAVLVALLVLVVELRRDVNRLEAAVVGAPTVGSAPLVEPVATDTVPQPIDLPPPDAESARRRINDTYLAVFDPATPREVWGSLVADPTFDLGSRLLVLAGGPCAGAKAVVTDIRFLGDDSAAVRFRFEGSGIGAADSFVFDGGALRRGDTWVVAPDGIDQVVQLATQFCT